MMNQEEIPYEEQDYICDVVCYADYFNKVLDNEPLINYKYAKKDTIVDNLFASHTLISSGVDITYYDGEYTRNVSYFVRFVGLYKQQVVDNDKIGFVVYLYGVLYDIRCSVHVAFRIAIDVTAMHYNNYIVHPNIKLDELECVSLLSDVEEKEDEVANCREQLKFIYASIIDRSTRDVTITDIQLELFTFSIYVPLRLVSLVRRYFVHRNNLINRLAFNCNCSSSNNTCTCISNMYYNSLLIYEMYQV